MSPPDSAATAAIAPLPGVAQTPARGPAYRRILLKLSGEALMGSDSYGIERQTIDRIVAEVGEVVRLGVQVAIVIGGGNIFRGVAPGAAGMDRATADYMGMLATVLNALALQETMEKFGQPTRVLSAISVYNVCEPFIRRRAIRHLEKGRTVILAAGTGNPFFTTDTCAALRATELEADVVLKATKVDGIYDSDPKKNPSAKLYHTVSYEEVHQKQLRVMDLTAITLCMERKIPVVVFNLKRDGNIARVLRGEDVGTRIVPGDGGRAGNSAIAQPVK